MSWVSILEDAIERLDSDLHMLRSDTSPSPECVSAAQWHSAVQLISRGEMILAEAAQYLDLATDPSIDLARELQSTTAEAHDLKRKVSEFQKTCLSLMSRLTQSEGEVKKLREELKTARAERNALERKLEESMRSNPAGVYAAYEKGSKRKK